MSKKKEPSGSSFLQAMSGLLNAARFNTCALTTQFAEVIEFSTTHFTVFIDGNRLDERTIHREDTLYTYVARHLANSETLLVLRTLDGNHVTTELLDTLLVTFFNTISNRYLVSGCKSRELFLLTGKCLFGNFQ